MCGIAGYFSSSSVNKQFLVSIGNDMGDALTHRGPDEKGIWINEDNKLVLSHRRLSIIDLSSRGSQPMHSSCNRFVIIFNGEIYNHHEIKKQILTSKSISFKGHSDTEILLESISLFGLNTTIKNTKGMFAFALWDKKKKILSLVRDRFGEKPLYYSKINNNFIFASELKAFKKIKFFKKDLNINSVEKFLKYSFIPAPNTIFKNVYKLMPSTILEISEDLKNIKEKKYWSLKKSFNKKIISQSEILDDVYENINNIVKSQMISDAPIGSFLSGGTDSTLISLVMQQNMNKKLDTFSIGYKDKKYDESYYYRKISKIIGSNNNEIVLSENDVINIIPNLSNVYDEPFADSSQLPSILISQLASHNVKVCLSGDGADEVFGGYNRYLWVKNYWPIISKMPLHLRKLISKIIKILPEHQWDLFYKYLTFYNNDKSLRLFGEKIYKVANSIHSADLYELHNTFLKTSKNSLVNSSEDNSYYNYSSLSKNLEPIDLFSVMDLENYLPNDILTKVDRSSMSHSLETRLPYLDHQLVEKIFNLPSNMKIQNGKTKWILKSILERYFPNDLINRPKMGFGVPIDKWLRSSLREWSLDLISEKRQNKLDIIDYKKANKILDNHYTAKNNFHHEIWNLLILQSWVDNNL